VSIVHSVFEATNLDFLLRNLSISHIVVMGLDVLGSVDACVQSAMDRGYHATVVTDAVMETCIGNATREKSTGDTIQTAGRASGRSLLDRVDKCGAQTVRAVDFVRELHSFAC
jgi:hypothetical protein